MLLGLGGLLVVAGTIGYFNAGNRRPDSPHVLVLTTFDDDEMLSGALRAGAPGFLLKDSSADDLFGAVRTVAAGNSWLDPAVTGRVLSSYRSTRPGGLTRRPCTTRSPSASWTVLVPRAAGRSNAEIAGRPVHLRARVKSHIGRIFTKLGLATARPRPSTPTTTAR